MVLETYKGMILKIKYQSIAFAFFREQKERKIYNII